jgi:hypothetical protein
MPQQQLKRTLSLQLARPCCQQNSNGTPQKANIIEKMAVPDAIHHCKALANLLTCHSRQLAKRGVTRMALPGAIQDKESALLSANAGIIIFHIWNETLEVDQDYIARCDIQTTTTHIPWAVFSTNGHPEDRTGLPKLWLEIAIDSNCSEDTILA